ncbi:leucine Rich repeat-containing domain protein [Onchocerca flexuosa]|uniref:Leucine Rich repeat-containing domain protein n=1 Tax=Onchocerca flexuosa TaxID=387005 RepID=A0A238BNQ6_9BILA|nr:leucine Rich repeat-containing domain protein [Onchocerca flexuosa]
MRFPGLPALFYLSVVLCSSNRRNITPCPDPCHCYSLESLHIVMDCSHSMLERFLPLEMIRNDSQFYDSVRSVLNNNQFILSEILELDISYNKLKDIPNFDDFYHLKRLNLEYNRIRSIPDEAMTSLNYLEELNLSNNQISEISEYAFKNLTFLRTLNLGGNNLKTLPSSLHILNLRELHLDDNWIEKFLPELSNFSSLKTLSLANNRISYIQPRSLIEYCKLENLNLARNPLFEVPRQILRQVALTLVKLNLSSTPIATIRSGDFTNLLAIQEIDLSYAKITKIEENSFCNLPKLLKLHLNGNPELEHISSGAFQLLPSLLLIHLHNCSLSGLDDLNLQSLPSLQHLTFYGNPSLCNCNLTWIQHLRHIVMDGKEIRCISKNKRYRNLHTFEILEKCPPRIIGLPTAITVMERKRLFLTCDAIGNPKPAIQWRDPTDAEISNERFLIFPKINQNQSGNYRCLAYSEAGLDEAKIFVNVIPRLKLQMLSINSTMAVISWHGKLPYNTTRLRVRFRYNSTEFVRNAEVNETRITVRFFREMFLDTIELCLLDGTTELVCDYFDNRKDSSEGNFIYLKFFVVSFCFILCAYNINFKFKRIDREVEMMRMTVNLERNPTFYNSSTLAVQILTRPKFKYSSEL